MSENTKKKRVKRTVQIDKVLKAHPELQTWAAGLMSDPDILACLDEVKPVIGRTLALVVEKMEAAGFDVVAMMAESLADDPAAPTEEESGRARAAWEDILHTIDILADFPAAESADAE